MICLAAILPKRKNQKSTSVSNRSSKVGAGSFEYSENSLYNIPKVLQWVLSLQYSRKFNIWFPDVLSSLSHSLLSRSTLAEEFKNLTHATLRSSHFNHQVAKQIFFFQNLQLQLKYSWFKNQNKNIASYSHTQRPLECQSFLIVT